LVNSKRVLAAKVEGLYSGKEQETFNEEKKLSIRITELSKVVRNVIGRGVNCEVECEEYNRLVVGELGRRMVAEEWSMAEETQVKNRRVTGRKSTTFAWVSKNIIAWNLVKYIPSPCTLIW